MFDVEVSDVSEEGASESGDFDNAELMGSSMEEEEISVQDFADHILVDLLG